MWVGESVIVLWVQSIVPGGRDKGDATLENGDAARRTTRAILRVFNRFRSCLFEVAESGEYVVFRVDLVPSESVECRGGMR